MDTLSTILLWLLGIDVVGIGIVEVIRIYKYLRYSFNGKHVLITGGSSGLGLELAKQIASEKATVTIVARRKDQLELAKQEIASFCKKRGCSSPSVYIIQGDVCNRDSIREAIHTGIQASGEVDVLICNAGTATTGYAFGQPINDYEKAIELNYMGTVNTLFNVVPSMIQRNKGEVYLVGSTCSMLSYTGYASYAPSKYAVKGLADGLRVELQRNHIQVGCIYPPNMDTPCLKKENETKPAEGLFVEKNLETLYSPETIAQRAITHIKKGDPHIYCDFDAWGVNLTSCGIGPYNNIFTSILFIIPGMIFTNLFRLLILGIYKMKRFTEINRQPLWIQGQCIPSQTEDTPSNSLPSSNLYKTAIGRNNTSQFQSHSHCVKELHNDSEEMVFTSV